MRQTGYFKIVSSCFSATQAEDVFPDQKPEVIFIDSLVQLNNSNGLLNYVTNHKPHIVAVSSVNDLSKLDFGFEISDFILKPISSVQIRRVVNKIILTESHNKKSAEDGSFIFVKVDRAFMKISTSEIQYIQALSDYVRIFTNSKVYTTYSTMKDMLGKLPDTDFLRVHRSYIVRMEAISQFKEGFLTIDKRLIPIGRLYKNDLMERLPILK